ncbi:hypothetical protein [Burkholderia ubonensis]|jgi:hypothetical protein|uniref:hypothetical protein n=1 Tax=Burkholderia ubonensis TaxID=101571 RepID=UPI00075E6BE1|nr:hypothetical protein [Burkholderia ubonensis]KVV25791.1 hypothetical protein WK79_10910 [Burkholderia ubonensis]
MDFILNAITGMMNTMSVVLGNWSFTRNLGQDMAMIMPYLQKANMILPVSEFLSVLSLWIGLQLVLAAYYWITRAINLLRGAG